MRGERSGRLVLGVYDEGHIGLADFVGDMEPPDNQQPEHCCLIKDAGIYRHHGRAADFFGGVDTKDH
ncbi:hypothetical protein TNCV_2153801 [Trichonephila clavipes]|nr:hypothetical protein TNCV_2153801 [Trichonephila clavipes]